MAGQVEQGDAVCVCIRWPGGRARTRGRGHRQVQGAVAAPLAGRLFAAAIPFRPQAQGGASAPELGNCALCHGEAFFVISTGFFSQSSREPQEPRPVVSLCGWREREHRPRYGRYPGRRAPATRPRQARRDTPRLNENVRSRDRARRIASLPQQISLRRVRALGQRLGTPRAAFASRVARPAGRGDCVSSTPLSHRVHWGSVSPHTSGPLRSGRRSAGRCGSYRCAR